MDASNANFHRVYTECCARVEIYCKRVAEARDVQAASDFAKFLFFSGIIGLLKENASPEPLKVDGAHLAWKLEDLIERCNGHFRSNGRASGVSPGELESVHEKLARVSANVEMLAGQICKLTAALGANGTEAGKLAHGLGAPAPGPGAGSLPCLFITTQSEHEKTESNLEADYGLKFITVGAGK